MKQGRRQNTITTENTSEAAFYTPVNRSPMESSGGIDL